MSSAMAYGLLIGIPLLVSVIYAAWYLRKKDPHPATYDMSQPWTHEPILWAADESLLGPNGVVSHGHAELTVGGGASGRW